MVDVSLIDIVKIALPLLATAITVVIGALVKMALSDRDKKTDLLAKHQEEMLQSLSAAHAEIKVLNERSLTQLKALEKLDLKLDGLERTIWETS